MRLTPGQIIRDYEIVNFIGEGGMGAVYLAEDKMLERKVAIKVLNPQISKDEQFVERFKQEAKVQANLIHPNIVSLYAFFEYENSLFMAMEYVKGITLKELIEMIGPIPEERAINIFSQVLDGVGFAHKKGVIHRDIKPSNILISENDAAKIMDFGLAKIASDRNLTKSGANLGTVFYMSPEQVRGEKDIDNRTDIYSLGVTFYKMLTARTPFASEEASEFSIMKEIVDETTADPRDIYPFISENTVRTYFKMVQKDKLKRFDSCEECKFSLLSNAEIKLETHNESFVESKHFSESKKILKGENSSKKSKKVIYSIAIGLIAIIGIIYAISGLDLLKSEEKAASYSSADEQKDSSNVSSALANDRNNSNDFHEQIKTANNGNIKSSNLKNEIDNKEVKDFTYNLMEENLLGRHSGAITALAISATGKFIAAGNYKTLKIYNAESQKNYSNLKDHVDLITSTAYSYDGLYIATSGADDRIYVYTATGNEKKSIIKTRKNGANVITISSNSEYLAAGGNDSKIIIYSINDASEVRELAGHKSKITALVFSRNSDIIASGSRDNDIRLWDYSTGKLIRTLIGHSGEINSIEFSKDGSLLVSSSDDGAVKLWDVKNASLLKTFQVSSAKITFAVLTFDGKYALCATSNKKIYVWSVANQTQVAELSVGSSITKIAAFPKDYRFVCGMQNGSLSTFVLSVQ